MGLETSDVEAIARLARIRIDSGDIPGYAESMSRILALVEQMNSIDTTGIEPMRSPHDLPAPLRADRITETDRSADFQAIAPATEAGLYLVPKVLD